MPTHGRASRAVAERRGERRAKRRRSTAKLCDLFSCSTQQFTEGDAHASLFGKEALPTSEELLELHVVFQQHHDVVAVDNEEGGLLPADNSLLSVTAHTIDRQE